MKIKVDHVHIILGEKGSVIENPVARAVREFFPEAIEVEAVSRVITVRYKDRHEDLPMPEIVDRWLDRFHDGEMVTPIEFDL